MGQGGLSGFDLWLKSQPPLWGPLAPSARQGFALCIFGDALAPSCGKSIPPQGFPAAVHTGLHLSGSAESGCLPVPADISLGQGVRLPILPSSLQPFPYLRGPRIPRTGSSPTRLPTTPHISEEAPESRDSRKSPRVTGYKAGHGQRQAQGSRFLFLLPIARSSLLRSKVYLWVQVASVVYIISSY